MHFKHLIITLVATSLLSAPTFASADRKNEKKDGNKHNSKQLPPGLQKKLDRGGKLPPGWKKKIAKGEILEESVYKHSKPVSRDRYPDIPVDTDGETTLRVEGKVIRVLDATREILDVLH